MDAPDYEYRGLLAETWDLLRGDTSGWADRAFYRDVIRQHGEPALDVGCGTGRLLLDYLGQGIDIDGVDNSPEMLRLCRAKAQRLGLRPTLYQQDMASLDLLRRYRTILVPSSSFQLLTEPAAAEAAMQRFHAHLEPGGALVMPFMLLWQGDAQQGTVEGDWGAPRERVRPENGALVRRWTRSTYDVAAQLEHTEDRFEVVLDGQVVRTEHHRRSPATRWYTHAQVEALYARAGFVDVRLLHGFTFEPVRPDDTLFTALGGAGGT
jgi:SAM-dependent methyltransferase